MVDSSLVSLGKAIATDIREVKQPGLLLPIRKHDETLMLVDWDGKMHGVMLTGTHAFIYFPITLQRSHEGLFVPETEVLVDFSSATTAVGRDEDEGLLVLEANKLSVIGKEVGKQFAYPQYVPLWTKVYGGSEATKAAFTEWGIGIRVGDTQRVLWRHKCSPTAG